MAATTLSRAPPLMKWQDLLSRPRPAPTRRIPYGKAPSQFVELWRPDGPGPHPAVIMVHGGCWTAGVASLDYMDYAAEDLRKRGIAVWNIEYRRVGEPQGGYPATFQDVGAAIDLIRRYGPAYSLDLGRVVALGHSAGGHLALWAAARWKLPLSSPLHAPDPLRIHGVVDIAGIPDLERDTDTACGAEVIGELVGDPSASRPNVYADTSPRALLPLGVRQVVIHGAWDETVAPAVGQAYAAAAQAAGDRVDVATPPGAHVEEVTPGQPAWARAVEAVQELLGSSREQIRNPIRSSRRMPGPRS